MASQRRGKATAPSGADRPTESLAGLSAAPVPAKRSSVATANGVQSSDGRLVRGQKTRTALLAAARTVFERDGFLEARITDISELAGYAHGTFYTHFDSKEAIFLEIAVDLQEQMLSEQEPEQVAPTTDPVDGIERANRRYLKAYQSNAKIMGIIDQASMFNDELRAIRQSRAELFSTRAKRQIVRLQRQGLADKHVEADLAAIALTSMISRYAYVWFVESVDLGVKIDFEKSVETLTLAWARTIGLDVSDWRRRRGTAARSRRRPVNSK